MIFRPFEQFAWRVHEFQSAIRRLTDKTRTQVGELPDDVDLPVEIRRAAAKREGWRRRKQERAR
jgi:hypothetical protein